MAVRIVAALLEKSDNVNNTLPGPCLDLDLEL